MNRYLNNLNKIEFVVTNACTGRCKHCSEAGHKDYGVSIDPLVAADAVRKIAAEYPIETVMTFGGEPLLYPEAVFTILSAASELHIPRRQVITSGYFSKDAQEIGRVAKGLAECGVNDLLLSVDAFHQESIPPAPVLRFARDLQRAGVPIRLSPAWLVDRTHENPYNAETRRILQAFAALGIPEGEGNVVFFEGNAKRYLADYFTHDLPANPYVEDPKKLKCISFCANGDVLGDNLYRCGIMEIINNYTAE